MFFVYIYVYIVYIVYIVYGYATAYYTYTPPLVDEIKAEYKLSSPTWILSEAIL